MAFSVNREVLDFDNGLNALNFLTGQGHADIVIAEADLPGIPGLELFATIKRKFPECVCILMSKDPANEKAAEDLALEAYLNKPFGLQDLFAIVQKFVVESDRPPPLNRS
jgi:DNA-binding NtrC family response regulator